MPTDSPAPAARRWTLGGLAVGTAVGGLGLLMIAAGGGAWDLAGGSARTLGAALAVVGLGVAGLVLALRGRGLAAAVDAEAPRLYPFAAPWLSAGIVLLAIVSVAGVVSACFAEYAGALDGGDSAAVPVPWVSSALFLIASAVFWVFAIWFVALIARLVRIGQLLEQRTGRNVYGSVRHEGLDAPKPLVPGTPSGAAPKCREPRPH